MTSSVRGADLSPRSDKPRNKGKKPPQDVHQLFIPFLPEGSAFWAPEIALPRSTLWGLLEAVEEESGANQEREGLNATRPSLRATEIWKNLKGNRKLKDATLVYVQTGTLIRLLTGNPDVLKEILHRFSPELGSDAAKDLAPLGPITKDWCQPILIGLQKDRERVRERASAGLLPPVKQTRVVNGREVQILETNPAIPTRDLESDILDELAACVLFGFKLRRCREGRHLTVGDEHFKYDCKVHQQEKRKVRLRDYLARKTK